MIVRRKFRFLPPFVGSYRFCCFRHASNGFVRELATMSFASQLARAMIAVCSRCNTNSRFCTLLSSLVSVGRQELEIDRCRRDFRWLLSGPLQHHLRLLDHTNKKCLRLLRPLLSSRPANSFGLPRPFKSMRLGVSFRT